MYCTTTNFHITKRKIRVQDPTRGNANALYMDIWAVSTLADWSSTLLSLDVGVEHEWKAEAVAVATAIARRKKQDKSSAAKAKDMMQARDGISAEIISRVCKRVPRWCPKPE